MGEKEGKEGREGAEGGHTADLDVGVVRAGAVVHDASEAVRVQRVFEFPVCVAG